MKGYTAFIALPLKRFGLGGMTAENRPLRCYLPC